MERCLVQAVQEARLRCQEMELFYVQPMEDMEVITLIQEAVPQVVLLVVQVDTMI